MMLWHWCADDVRNGNRYYTERANIGGFSENDEAAAERRARRRAGGRIVAVGTTVVRALETAVDAEGQIRPGSGWTDKFILPPYRFGAVDALVTNFHLPCSSLLLLVAAFAGRPVIMDTYKIALKNGYRFYSYGDAMLIQ